MFLRNKNKIYVVTAIIICIGVVFGWFFCTQIFTNHTPAVETSKDKINFKTIQIGEATVRAELATTEAEQIQGLSGRAFLATSTGMFFVFKYSSNWGIWMKDMNFPIDVLWISDNLKVSYIVENMLPSSYPNVYAPPISASDSARYVLEVPAGTVRNYGIVNGETVSLK